MFDNMIVRNTNELNRVAAQRRGLPWTPCASGGAMTKDGLVELYFNVRSLAGWHSRLYGHFSPAEMDFLSDLDTRQRAFERELEMAWRASRSKLKRPEVDAAWARGRRKEYLEGQLAVVKTALMEFRLERGQLVRQGDDDSAAFVSFFEADAAAEVHKFKEQLAKLEAPEPDTSTRIPEEMIQRAREVRIGALLGVDEKKRIKCPFHGEDKHPAGSIVKGFFKCFVCDKGPIDAITWLMEVEGYSFPAAVHRLVGI